MSEIELTEATFQQCLKDTLEVGRELERERIVHALNNDAVIQTAVSVVWLEYIVRLIEGTNGDE